MKKDDILAAALSCAQNNDWAYVDERMIAQQADIKLSEFYEFFDDKDDVLRHYGRRLDVQIMEAFEGQSLEGDSVKDRLFDILMERFDLLNDHRAALLSIIKSMRYDLKKAMITMPYIAKSMDKMLVLSGADHHGWRGCITVSGLTAIYLEILCRTWVKDESADLSATMAALDKALSRADSWAQTLGL